jgi:hypothetical protein
MLGAFFVWLFGFKWSALRAIATPKNRFALKHFAGIDIQCK